MNNTFSTKNIFIIVGIAAVLFIGYLLLSYTQNDVSSDDTSNTQLESESVVESEQVKEDMAEEEGNDVASTTDDSSSPIDGETSDSEENSGNTAAALAALNRADFSEKGGDGTQINGNEDIIIIAEDGSVEVMGVPLTSTQIINLDPDKIRAILEALAEVYPILEEEVQRATPEDALALSEVINTLRLLETLLRNLLV